MRYRPKLDVNQRGIVSELRGYPGLTVHSTAALGCGFPDIIVGYQARNWLFEIKNHGAPPSKRKLTEDEAAWHMTWCGHVDVAESADDVLLAIGYEVK